jgi:hypothetical protein
VEVEAAKGEQYCWPILRALQHMRCTPAVEEKNYNVMYTIESVHLTFRRQTGPIL